VNRNIKKRPGVNVWDHPSAWASSLSPVFMSSP